MKKFKEILFLNAFGETLSENDLVSRQRLRLFKIATLFSVAVYVAFLLQASVLFSSQSLVIFLISILFVGLFVNYFALAHHKKPRAAYIILLLISFLVLHIATYYEGGIRNSGMFYLAGLILAAFMLLGNMGGKVMAGISLIHIVYFYFISRNTTWVSYALIGNEPRLIDLDFLLTATISILVVTAQSNYLQRSKRAIIEDIKSKRDELALKNYELKKLSLVASKTNNGVIITDNAGNVEWVNDGFTRLMGFGFLEIVGKKQCDLLYGNETSKKTIDRITEILSGKKNCSEEILKYHKDGHKLWIQENITPILDDDQEIVKYIFIENDITKRKETDQKLTESEKRYRLVTENPILGIAWISPEGRLINANDALCEMLEYSPIEIFDKHYSEFSHPDDLERDIIILQNFLKGRKDNFQFEKRYITKSKEIIWAELNISSVRNDQGEMIYCIAILKEITQRKLAEELLQKSEANLRNILENTDTAYILLDVKMCILSYNRIAKELALTEIGEPLIEGKNYLDMIPEGRRSEVENAIRTVLKEVKPISYEAKYPQREGPDTWLHIIMHPILNKGKVVGLSIAITNITDRKFADEKIKTSEAHLQASQRIAHVGSWELELKSLDPTILIEDPNASSLRWSDETYRIFGLEPGKTEISLAFFFTRVSGKDQFIMQKGILKAIETNTEFNIEHRIFLLDGTERMVHERADVIYDPITEMPIKLVGTSQDITEQKLAEELMKRNNERYEFITKATNDAIWDWNLITDELYKSEGHERLFGYTDSEGKMSMHSAMNRIHPDDKDSVLASLNRQIKNPESNYWEEEYRYLKSNGDTAYVFDRGYIIYDEDKKPIRMVGAMHDITERKLSEDALALSERKFRSLIENALDTVIVMNDVGDIVFASDSITRITGFGTKEILGHSANEYVHPDDIVAAQNHFMGLAATPGKSAIIIQRVLKTDGSYIWCECMVTNLLHDPAVMGMVSNFREITERKEAEESLKAYNAELKKSNMELDKFVYSVSHDLRAPLCSMLGLVEYSGGETNDPEMLEYLSILKENIKKLDGFILDILDYSRNARVEVRREEVHFREMLEDITGNLKFMGSNNRAVNIQLNIHDDTLFCSDNYRMRVVFNNLISNAIRYQDPDTKTPIVNIKIDTSDSEASIVVSDNGIGINKEFHEKIFDMFYRVSEKSVGSGLGLYIVKEAITTLKGTINFESEPGKGTTFSIHIPNNN